MRECLRDGAGGRGLNGFDDHLIGDAVQVNADVPGRELTHVDESLEDRHAGARVDVAVCAEVTGVRRWRALELALGEQTLDLIAPFLALFLQLVLDVPQEAFVRAAFVASSASSGRVVPGSVMSVALWRSAIHAAVVAMMRYTPAIWRHGVTFPRSIAVHEGAVV